MQTLIPNEAHQSISYLVGQVNDESASPQIIEYYRIVLDKLIQQLPASCSNIEKLSTILPIVSCKDDKLSVDAVKKLIDTIGDRSNTNAIYALNEALKAVGEKDQQYIIDFKPIIESILSKILSLMPTALKKARMQAENSNQLNALLTILLQILNLLNKLPYAEVDKEAFRNPLYNIFNVCKAESTNAEIQRIAAECLHELKCIKSNKGCSTIIEKCSLLASLLKKLAFPAGVIAALVVATPVGLAAAAIGFAKIFKQLEDAKKTFEELCHKKDFSETSVEGRNQAMLNATEAIRCVDWRSEEICKNQDGVMQIIGELLDNLKITIIDSLSEILSELKQKGGYIISETSSNYLKTTLYGLLTFSYLLPVNFLSSLLDAQLRWQLSELYQATELHDSLWTVRGYWLAILNRANYVGIEHEAEETRASAATSTQNSRYNNDFIIEITTLALEPDGALPANTSLNTMLKHLLRWQAQMILCSISEEPSQAETDALIETFRQWYLFEDSETLTFDEKIFDKQRCKKARRCMIASLSLLGYIGNQQIREQIQCIVRELEQAYKAQPFFHSSAGGRKLKKYAPQILLATEFKPQPCFTKPDKDMLIASWKAADETMQQRAQYAPIPVEVLERYFRALTSELTKVPAFGHFHEDEKGIYNDQPIYLTTDCLQFLIKGEIVKDDGTKVMAEVPVEDIFKASSPDSHIVCIGPAGVGKTSFGRYLVGKINTQKLWKDRFSEGAIWIPVRNLSNCTIPSTGSIDWPFFFQQLYKGYFDLLGIAFDGNESRKFCESIALKMQSGKAVAVIDGLDELPEKHPNIFHLLSAFQNEDSGFCPNIAYTSRPYGEVTKFKNNKIIKYHMSGLNKEQVTSFIESFYSILETTFNWEPGIKTEAISSFHRAIISPEDKSLQEMVQSPLTLSILLSIWRDYNKQPSDGELTLERLYTLMVDKLSNRYLLHPIVNDYYNTHEFRQSPADPYRQKTCKKKIMRAIANVAIESMKSNAVYFSHDFITTHLENLFPPNDEFNPIDHLRHAGFINKRVDDYYEFPHLSLRAYCTALALEELLETDIGSFGKLVATHRLDPNWQQVFDFVIQRLATCKKDSEKKLISVFRYFVAPPYQVRGDQQALMITGCLRALRQVSTRKTQAWETRLFNWATYYCLSFLHSSLQFATCAIPTLLSPDEFWLTERKFRHQNSTEYYFNNDLLVNTPFDFLMECIKSTKPDISSTLKMWLAVDIISSPRTLGMQPESDSILSTILELLQSYLDDENYEEYILDELVQDLARYQHDAVAKTLCGLLDPGKTRPSLGTKFQLAATLVYERNTLDTSEILDQLPPGNFRQILFDNPHEKVYESMRKSMRGFINRYASHHSDLLLKEATVVERVENAKLIADDYTQPISEEVLQVFIASDLNQAGGELALAITRHPREIGLRSDVLKKVLDCVTMPNADTNLQIQIVNSLFISAQRHSRKEGPVAVCLIDNLLKMLSRDDVDITLRKMLVLGAAQMSFSDVREAASHLEFLSGFFENSSFVHDAGFKLKLSNRIISATKGTHISGLAAELSTEMRVKLFQNLQTVSEADATKFELISLLLEVTHTSLSSTEIAQLKAAIDPLPCMQWLWRSSSLFSSNRRYLDRDYLPISMACNNLDCEIDDGFNFAMPAQDRKHKLLEALSSFSKPLPSKLCIAFELICSTKYLNENELGILIDNLGVILQSGSEIEPAALKLIFFLLSEEWDSARQVTTNVGPEKITRLPFDNKLSVFRSKITDPLIMLKIIAGFDSTFVSIGNPLPFIDFINYMSTISEVDSVISEKLHEFFTTYFNPFYHQDTIIVLEPSTNNYYYHHNGEQIIIESPLLATWLSVEPSASKLTKDIESEHFDCTDPPASVLAAVSFTSERVRQPTISGTPGADDTDMASIKTHP